MLTHDQSDRVARLRYDLNHRIMPFVRLSQSFVQVPQEFRAGLAALVDELRGSPEQPGGSAELIAAAQPVLDAPSGCEPQQLRLVGEALAALESRS